MHPHREPWGIDCVGVSGDPASPGVSGKDAAGATGVSRLERTDYCQRPKKIPSRARARSEALQLATSAHRRGDGGTSRYYRPNRGGSSKVNRLNTLREPPNRILALCQGHRSNAAL
jgi:hypothetical protein